MRKANILNLKWSQVNLESQSIKIDASEFKNGNHHEQPISGDAVNLLGNLAMDSSLSMYLSIEGSQ